MYQVKLKLLPLLLVGVLTVGATSSPAQAQNIGSGIIIDEIVLEGVNIVGGVLTAASGTVSGTIGGLPFTTDIANFQLDFEPDGEDGACSILDLELGPIDLDLLGLHVDTTPICLDITAIEGGGLLGDLLCGLSGILDGLVNLDDLTDALEMILSEVLTDALAQEGDPPSGAEDICDGDCEVLHLAVGPVDLTLLGLNVYLDDCDEGPVQVCVSASQGQGLLGDLLCGLAGGGTLPNLGQLEDLLDAIAGLLDQDVSNRQVAQLTQHVGRMLRDGQLTNQELDWLRRAADKAVNGPGVGPLGNPPGQAGRGR